MQIHIKPPEPQEKIVTLEMSGSEVKALMCLLGSMSVLQMREKLRTSMLRKAVDENTAVSQLESMWKTMHSLFEKGSL